jgi:hypothetical protein
MVKAPQVIEPAARPGADPGVVRRRMARIRAANSRGVQGFVT